MDPVNETAVRLIPLGGLGEIGLNMMLIEYGDDVIAVDCGLMFPDDELPGIDYVIPDFSYALAKRDGFRGVVLTHGHEDHIGALPYLLKSARVPIYATPLTQALVAEKLREHGLFDQADLRPMRPRTPFTLGPFTIEPIRVTHSIADGMGLAIGTPAGTIVHTGDFKLDPSPLDGEPADIARFTELGEQGVAVLCSDSTNVDRPGHTRSEIEVGAALAERFDAATGRIILATFASHIHRSQQVLTLAAARGRHVALLGPVDGKERRHRERARLLTVPRDCCARSKRWLRWRRSARSSLHGSQGERTGTGAHGGRRAQVRADRARRSRRHRARVHSRQRAHGGRVINRSTGSAPSALRRSSLRPRLRPPSQEYLKLILKLTNPRFFVPVPGSTVICSATPGWPRARSRSRARLLDRGRHGIEVTPTTARFVTGYPPAVLGTARARRHRRRRPRDRQILAEDGSSRRGDVRPRGALVAGPESRRAGSCT